MKTKAKVNNRLDVNGALRRKKLIELGKILSQYRTGGVSFGDPKPDGMIPVFHNGVSTPYSITPEMHYALTTNEHPRPPKIEVKSEYYELTPEMLEEEFPTVFQYVQDCVLYVMLISGCTANNIAMDIERTGKNALRYTFSEKRDDGGEGMDSEAPEDASSN